MRFGLMDFATGGADAWRARAQRAEQLGFDVLWTGDHLFHFARPETPFLDGWVLLSAWTAVTSRIRLGMLVANLSWRSPVLVARAAVAVDQLSAGRLELGVGAGAFADQAMAGVLAMPARERIGRLREGTQVLDRLLRGDVSPFAGTYTAYAAAEVAPGCVQAPRPPLTLAANGPRALRVAAELADAWNTWGGLDLAVGEFRSATAARARTLEAHCERLGRDPATIRRSLLVYHRFVDPWASTTQVERLVEAFAPLGFTEYVFNWPRPEQEPVFEQAALEVLPALRGRPGRR